VDLEEAWRSGFKAAEIAATDGNGFMSTILRKPGAIYGVDYDKVPLEAVANSERTFPREWLTKEGWDVTDDFVAYARPLIGEDNVSVPTIGGLFRFARLRPIFADKKLPAYIPQAIRA
jgi:6-phosphofructokinase 1